MKSTSNDGCNADLFDRKMSAKAALSRLCRRLTKSGPDPNFSKGTLFFSYLPDLGKGTSVTVPLDRLLSIIRIIIMTSTPHPHEHN